MKRNVKNLQLKKRSISVLNTKEIKGGVTTTLVTALCKSKIYDGEDNCVSISNQR